jgi:hypothetical protein
MIPTSITSLGFEPTGNLSTLYITKSNSQFFAGLFNRDKQLYIAINCGKEKFLMVPILEKQVDALLRGTTSLMEIIRNADEIFAIPENKTITGNRLRLALRLFYQATFGRIKTIPNAFYHWNEYHFKKELIKHNTYCQRPPYLHLV